MDAAAQIKSEHYSNTFPPISSDLFYSDLKRTLSRQIFDFFLFVAVVFFSVQITQAAPPGNSSPLLYVQHPNFISQLYAYIRSMQSRIKGLPLINQ